MLGQLTFLQASLKAAFFQSPTNTLLNLVQMLYIVHEKFVRGLLSADDPFYLSRLPGFESRKKITRGKKETSFEWLKTHPDSQRYNQRVLFTSSNHDITV